MRLVYTADLHGNTEHYAALLDLAAAVEAQAVVVGGDLMPHAISAAAALDTQRGFVERELRPLLARFRARHPSTAVYLLPGNDDWAAAYAAVEALAGTGLAEPLHERVYALGPGLWLAGYACVPPTPFSIKDYERLDDAPPPPYTFEHAYTSREGWVRPMRREELDELAPIGAALEALARQSDPAQTIYVCHAPPAGTPLDAMAGGRHVGSRALRSFIERHAPPLTLHGHIHEAPRVSGRWAARLGTSWCVNPGRDQRRFHGVTIDIGEAGVRLEHTLYGVVTR